MEARVGSEPTNDSSLGHQGNRRNPSAVNGLLQRDVRLKPGGNRHPFSRGSSVLDAASAAAA